MRSIDHCYVFVKLLPLAPCVNENSSHFIILLSVPVSSITQTAKKMEIPESEEGSTGECEQIIEWIKKQTRNLTRLQQSAGI